MLRVPPSLEHSVKCFSLDLENAGRSALVAPDRVDDSRDVAAVHFL